jgi:hypothetical protein
MQRERCTTCGGSGVICTHDYNAPVKYTKCKNCAGVGTIKLIDGMTPREYLYFKRRDPNAGVPSPLYNDPALTQPATPASSAAGSGTGTPGGAAAPVVITWHAYLSAR